MADKALEIYLNDHLAGAMLGTDLAEQIRERERGRSLRRRDDGGWPAQIEEDRGDAHRPDGATGDVGAECRQAGHHVAGREGQPAEVQRAHLRRAGASVTSWRSGASCWALPESSRSGTLWSGFAGPLPRDSGDRPGRADPARDAAARHARGGAPPHGGAGPGVNRLHHWYCNRDAWKRHVREELAPTGDRGAGPR